MANIIKIKRGLKTNLPTLEEGELGYCTDTNELFVGTASGNNLVNEETDLSNYYTETEVDTLLNNKADLASPTLTGTPIAPTATAGTNTTQIATTAFVQTAVSELVSSAPEALDTLNELAAALGDDPNFATTVSNDIGTKANKTITITGANGLTGGGDLTTNRTISHADTSTQASVTNSNATVIQDVTLDTYGHVTALGSTTLNASTVGAEPAFTKNTAFNKNFGTSAGTVTQGNDARLSDSRTPTAHTHGDISNTGAITSAVTIASGDHLVIADHSQSNRLETSSITFGTGTSTFLANNGTWQSPPVPDLPNQASISHITNTGSVTNTHTRQVNASVASTASSANSQINASANSGAFDQYSQINASANSGAYSNHSQINASEDVYTDGMYCQINASTYSETTGFSSQINASLSSYIYDGQSQINASQDSETNGFSSQINACDLSVTNGFQSQINGCFSCVTNGGQSQINGSEVSETNGNYSQINASMFSKTNASFSQINVSKNTINNTSYSLAGGFLSSGETASTANRKWHIFSQTGNVQIAGTLSSNVNFSDFAELFPNATGQAQGYGLLQTLDGYGVKSAQEGERVIGVVSGTAGILLNDTSFHWQGRYLVDEWGMPIYEEIKDSLYKLESDYIKEYQEKHSKIIIVDEIPEEKEKRKQYKLKKDILKSHPHIVKTEDEIPFIKVQKENPDYDIEREQISRKERPDEWTVVGLTGQVYVRLNKDVKVGDSVKAWKDGIGQTSETDTNIVVMKITQPYDENKGYAIGFCLIK